MKKLLLALLIATVASTGCQSQENASNTQNTNNETLELRKDEDMSDTKSILQKNSRESLDGLLSRSYPQKELLNAVNFGGTDNTNTTLHLLNERFPIEAIRTFDDDSLAYCVYALEEGGFLYTFFHDYEKVNRDSTESLLYANYVFVVKETLTQSSFDSIKVGNTLTDVERIDKGRELFNEMNIWGLLPFGETYHMVKEGFVSIKYDVPDGVGSWERYNSDDFIVNSIKFIPNGSDLIEPQDENFYGSPPVDFFKYTLLESDYPQSIG